MRRRIRHCLHERNAARSGGFSLVEVTVAVIVLALITAAVPPTLGMLLRSQFTQNEHRIAESLSRNQIEYVKSSDYISANSTNPEPQYETVPAPDTYEIDVTIQPIRVDPDTRAHEALAEGNDEGLQEITVAVYHTDRQVLETRGYKVDR